jgi:hypothetical protein
MKKRQSVLGLALMAIFLTVVALTLSAGGQAAASETVERPFKMDTYEVVTDKAPSAACPVEHVQVVGEGTATHLGNLTLTRSHCFSPEHSPPVYNGHWEATAANGDKIWGSYDGTLIPTEFDDNGMPVRGIVDSPFTVEGGSGRFAGAGGAGTFTGDYDLVNDVGYFHGEGTLDY